MRYVLRSKGRLQQLNLTSISTYTVAILLCTGCGAQSKTETAAKIQAAVDRKLPNVKHSLLRGGCIAVSRSNASSIYT